jgi:hemolysin activation/secretion protein
MASALPVWGQQINSASPNFNSIAPKSAQQPAPAGGVAVPAPPVTTNSDDAEELLTNLTGVVIIASRSALKPDGIPSVPGGVRVEGPAFLVTNDAVKLLKPYLGKPATKGSLRQMERKLILLCRAEDHPVVDVTLPEQNVDSGVIQLIILEGKVGKIIIEHNGKRWFSEKITRNGIRLKEGDAIVEHKLIDDINWLNWNPGFRDVNVAFKQGELGSAADVVIQETDHFPVKVDLGFDNAGVKLVGQNRVFGGLDWDNAFGLGQKINYQYTTDEDFEYFRAHSAIWEIPLPWRHMLTIFGSYANLQVDFPALGIHNNATQTGINDQISLRYAIPLPNLWNYSHEVSAGFDYKYANNNFDAGFGPQALIRTPTEIEQFVGAYRGTLPDNWGKSDVGVQAFYSPGGLSSENDTTKFAASRTGATAGYYYLKFNADRLIDLPWKCSFYVQGTAQCSDANLLPTEEFSLGGVETIRGYDERLVNGDEGWVINSEFRFPAFPVASLFESGIPDSLQFLGFCDYGYTQVESGPALVGYEPEYKLASVGGGLRYNLNSYLAVRLDYGYQLIRNAALLAQPGVNSSFWQGHVSVVATF